MSKKEDKIFKNLSKLKELSQIQSIQKNQYRFVYTPQKINGPFMGISFKLKMILPNSYPQISPQIYFEDIPYHLNIDKNTGRLVAAFLYQDWCSFMGFDSIIQEMKSIIEKPQQNSALCQKMKNQYFQNKNVYLQKINFWKLSKGVAKTNYCSIAHKNDQIESKLSYPDSIKQNPSSPKLMSSIPIRKMKSIDNSRQSQLSFPMSPMLRRKGSSALITSQKLLGKNKESNPLKTTSYNRIQPSYVSPSVSGPLQKNSKTSENPGIHSKVKQKQSNMPLPPQLKQKVNFDEQQKCQVQQQIKMSKKSREQKQSRQKNNKIIKHRIGIQKKQTIDLRMLFKQKKQQNQELMSSQSIEKKIQDQKTIHNSQKLQKNLYQHSREKFQIQILSNSNNHQTRKSKNSDQLKTRRRVNESHIDNYPEAEIKQNKSLSQSLKTIRLKQKLCPNQQYDSKSKDNLQKVNLYIEAMMNQCKTIQRVLYSTQNQKYRRVLQRKLIKQAQFIQNLQNLAFSLKRSIVDGLTREVQQML